jgi:NADH dehydrogenase
LRRRENQARVDIVIIGAGATGVELAAEIRQTTREHAGYGLDHIDPVRDVRLTLVEAAPRILPALPEHTATAAAELVRKLDIEMRVNEPVNLIDAEGVAYHRRQDSSGRHCGVGGGNPGAELA